MRHVAFRLGTYLRDCKALRLLYTTAVSSMPTVMV
jgi:hypothetical protein